MEAVTGAPNLARDQARKLEDHKLEDHKLGDRASIETGSAVPSLENAIDAVALATELRSARHLSQCEDRLLQAATLPTATLTTGSTAWSGPRSQHSSIKTTATTLTMMLCQQHQTVCSNMVRVRKGVTWVETVSVCVLDTCAISTLTLQVSARSRRVSVL
jgi:hypothetical protein